MSVDNFAILAFVDPFEIVTTPSGMEIFESQVHGSPCQLPPYRVWNYRSDLQAGVEIYYWGRPQIWLILSSQEDPLLGPQFDPPVWSIGGPISLCPQEAWTEFQVVHSDESPRSRLLSCIPLALPWPGGPRVGMTPILVILAS